MSSPWSTDRLALPLHATLQSVSTSWAVHRGLPSQEVCAASQGPTRLISPHAKCECGIISKHISSWSYYVSVPRNIVASLIQMILTAPAPLTVLRKVKYNSAHI